MVFLGTLLLLPLFAQNAAEGTGRLMGVVADITGAHIPKAGIKVFQPGQKNSLALRLKANESGEFLTQPLPAGVYSLAADHPGFRRREVRDVVINAGAITMLDKLVLDFQGCDSPDIICDDFGLSSPAEIEAAKPLAFGTVTLRPGCAFSLNQTSQVICPDSSEPAGQSQPASRQTELRLLREDDSLCLLAQERARIALLDTKNESCTSAAYSMNRLPIAGLGPGTDFCVRTNTGSLSHVFFVEDVEDSSEAVRLYYVTRRQ